MAVLRRTPSAASSARAAAHCQCCRCCSTASSAGLSCHDPSAVRKCSCEFTRVQSFKLGGKRQLRGSSIIIWFALRTATRTSRPRPPGWRLPHTQGLRRASHPPAQRPSETRGGRASSRGPQLLAQRLKPLCHARHHVAAQRSNVGGPAAGGVHTTRGRRRHAQC